MKEFDFDSVGKRMPYNVPEGFFEQTKAKARNVGAGKPFRSREVLYRVAVAVVAAVVVICGVAVWLDDFYSPKKQYQRLLAEVSSDVLWEYACEYDTDVSSENLY